MTPQESTKERYEKKFGGPLKFIQMDNKKTIILGVPLWNISETLLSFIESECTLREERSWKANDKWGDAHATFVSNVMDGMRSDEAYSILTKTLSHPEVPQDKKKEI